MISSLLAGALLAVTFSAPPGPVMVETVRRGLRGGFRPALLVQLGSLVGDMAWCAGALFGLAPLVGIPWVRLMLGGLGTQTERGGRGGRTPLMGVSPPPSARAFRFHSPTR